MGNQQAIKNQRDTLKRRAYNKSIQQQSSNKKNQLYTINQSLEHPSSAQNRPKYHSIDYGNGSSNNQDTNSLKSDRRKNKQDAQRDQILKKLSLKNEELRKQLKKISDELTEQLRHKKFVPKRKTGGDDDEQKEEKSTNTAGLKRELENGYKQIEMYKRTIESLKGREEKEESDVRIKRLENTVSSIDAQINEYIKKVEGMKKINKGQDKVIEKDMNEDLIGGVQSFKKEVQDMKNTLKEIQKKERQRQVNYKKQQAYLFEVEKKWREMNGDYFPELKKKAKQQFIPVASRVTSKDPKPTSGVSPKEYLQILEELNRLKSRHDEYHRKIDGIILQKNKIMDEQSSIDQNIKYSEKIIEALKIRLKEINKIFKPTKKSLFGYDSHNNNYEGTELQSNYNGAVDQIQKEIQEQINQDQFDIRHLIANIPKPSRPKVVIEFEEKKGKVERQPSLGREQSDKAGMIISGEKSQPKKWGSALTRVEQKGRQIRKEGVFDDTAHFNADAKPLIIGINIWVNKNNGIMGLQAIYLNDDEIRYGTKSSAAADGFLQRYDLQSPDYLKNMTGAFSQEGYLEYLVLYSKQGKVGTFGFKNQGQEIFTFGLSSAQRPFRVFGASFVFDSEPRINRLGIEICQQN